MMRVLMDRLFESYTRLNAAQKLQGRVQYFVDHRQDLRLDVKNIRLQAPKPADYSTGFLEDDIEDIDGIEDMIIDGDYFSNLS